VPSTGKYILLYYNNPADQAVRTQSFELVSQK
jgi:hypothetical protein